MPEVKHLQIISNKDKVNFDGDFLSTPKGIKYNVELKSNKLDLNPIFNTFLRDDLKKMKGVIENLHIKLAGTGLQPVALWDNMNGSVRSNLKDVKIPNSLSKIKLYYSHPFAFKSLSSMFEKNDRGRCGIFGIIGVLGSGKYALCGIGENISEMIFGDVEKDKLADIWHNNSMLNEIREGLPSKLEGICGDCIMKSMCLGQCIANNYFVNHNLFAPYWFCEEAHKMKLFPESRLVPGSISAKELSA